VRIEKRGWRLEHLFYPLSSIFLAARVECSEYAAQGSNTFL
jgi:hypothetical protein